MLMLIANRMRAFLVGLVMRVVFFARYVAGEQMSTFQCCICGHHNTAPLARIKQREQRSCYHCGSTMRFRSVVAALSLKLHGKIIPVNNWEAKPQVRGGGMSDPNLYALRIKHKLSYTNYYYHKQPYLDILDVDKKLYGTLDFMISTEVFEHVTPPVDRAFKGLYNILAPHGFAIFSVPYVVGGETKEHFPNLHEFRLERRGGKQVLVNTTKDGVHEEFTDITFHGGWGQTLEMRIFALEDLQRRIREAGFTQIDLLDASYPDFGIYADQGDSFVFCLQK